MKRLLPILLGGGLLSAAEYDDSQILVQRIQELQQMTNLVQRSFVDPVSRDDLWAGALRGMLANLDGYSRYLTPDEVALQAGHHAGRGFGYGFDWRFDMVHGSVRILRVIPASPAWNSDLLPGDIILRLDDEPLQDLGQQRLRQRLLRDDDPRHLHVQHADGTQVDIELTRGDFTDSGVLPGRMLPGHIGLVAIARFRDDTSNQDQRLTTRKFREEIDRLSSAGMEALIIDLRGNGGGSLLAAVEIADCFLNAGHDKPRVIVEQISRNPARNNQFVARSTNTYPDWPMVVLIDGNTASSAELLAAALADHRRATLIGEHTAGKNTVQELFLLESGAGMLVTVARFRGPAGHDHSGVGVSPHIEHQLKPVLRQQLLRQQRLLSQDTELPPKLQAVSDPQVDLAQRILLGTLIHLSH